MAIRRCRVGLLTVTIDTHGGNLTNDSKKNIAANRDKIL